jgi:A/G-specific adenine glycosylase
VKPPCNSDPLRRKKAFGLALESWFREYGQDHPWRKTQDPWAILVSEVMLQQTTVMAVKAGRRFELFLEQFPDLESIANSEEPVLLKAWEGLGYYNRVRSLQKAARAVLQDWNGIFPRDAATLETLPGIGPYTAGAIASFAFNEPAPLVDGNVARVLTRLMDCQMEIDGTAGRMQIWEWSGILLDREQPRLFNSALMELGQTICRARDPACLECPVAEFCQTRVPEGLPRKKPRAKTVLVTEHAVLARRDGRILLAKEAGSRRKGFYRFPLRSGDAVADLNCLKTSQYSITKHRVTLHLYQVTGDDIPGGLQEGEIWVSLSEMAELPMPSPIRRVLSEVMPDFLP